MDNKSKVKIQYEENNAGKGGNNGKKGDTSIREILIDNAKKQKQHELNIDGIQIFFPHQPYENQIVYMKKVIEALNKGAIAGLESPTGTGKTLCLLCASLGWLRTKRKEMRDNPDLYDDVPKILYSSRTHSQLTGVIKELKKTCYLPRTAVLSSRDNMCVNPVVKKFRGNLLNLKCKQARYRKDCKYFFGSERLLISNYDSCDIEELVEVGSRAGFCPFFFQRNKKDYADITFLPYNYILEPNIRNVIKLKLGGTVVIIDEAHNIESVCEDAVSCQLSTKTIDEIIGDLNGIKTLIDTVKETDKESFLNSIDPKKIVEQQNILTSIKSYIKSFNIKQGKFWPDIGLKLTAKEMFDIFFEGSKGKDRGQQFISKSAEPQGGLKPDNLNDHIEFLKKIDAGISDELQKSSIISEYIRILSLVKILSDNYLHCIEANDTNPLNNFTNNFKFFLNDIDDNAAMTFQGNKKSFLKNKARALFLYCFNPGFGFKELFKENITSIIITSGTLSPISGIESELKCSFDVKLENTHVVDKSQINFSLLSFSLFHKNVQFRFDKGNRENWTMIEDLGKTIVELSKITPGGILVFFPSFFFLNSALQCWAKAQIISDLEQYKEIFQDLHDGNKNKMVLKKYTEANKKNKLGGILFSVFRGTTSEGIDFSDDYARMVILVGIPYPNLGDVKVQLKKEYLDEFNRKSFQFIGDKKVQRLSGNDWYSQSASRTVNQALGRVIRHIGDYGSMVLIDVRFREMLNKRLISGWLRDCARLYCDDTIIKDIKNFFERMKTLVVPKVQANNKLSMIKDYENSFDRDMNQSKELPQKKRENLNSKRWVESKKPLGESNSSCFPMNSESAFSLIDDVRIPKVMELEDNSRSNNLNLNNSLMNSKEEKKSTPININLSTGLMRNGKFLKKSTNQPQIKEGTPEKSHSRSRKKSPKTKPDNSINIHSNNNIKQKNNQEDDDIDPDIMEFINNNSDMFFKSASKDSKNGSEKKEKEPTKNKPISASANNNHELITPCKEEKKDTEEIKSALVIKKLLELKDRSELNTLLEKYNLKIEFESESKKKEEQKTGIHCPVCFRSNEEEEGPSIEFLSSKCGHILCKECWDKCLKNKLECPLCKTKTRANTLIRLFINN